MRTPRILWPAPGLPALTGAGEASIDAVVCHDEPGPDALRDWAARLGLRESPERPPVPLALLGVDPLRREELDRGAAAAALPEHRALRFARVRLRAPRLAPDPRARRVRVFDLAVGARSVRPRAVARRTGPADGRLTLAFASDLHVASVWDTLADALARRAPQAAQRFLHPNRQLDALVTEANALADRGGLDALVLGGDLVDHVYALPPREVSGRAEESHVAVLVEALSRLRVPAFAIAGNHDHRLFPWRPRAYGLASVGVPRGELRAVLEAAGLWDRWPLRPSDRDALRTEERSGRTSLAHHLTLLAPETDYTVDVGDLRLVFLSTGRDLLPRWRELEAPRRGLALRAIPSSWHHPDSEGLSHSQLDLLARALAGARGTALFHHAPLLNPAPGARVEERLAHVDPGEGDDLCSHVAFERHLFRSGLRQGVFFRHPARYVRELARAPGAVAALSGHVHRSHAMQLDRRSLRVRSEAFERVRSDEDHVPLLNAPALGQESEAAEGCPGYLLARFENGRLVAAERRVLRAADGAHAPRATREGARLTSGPTREGARLTSRPIRD